MGITFGGGGGSGGASAAAGGAQLWAPSISVKPNELRVYGALLLRCTAAAARTTGASFNAAEGVQWELLAQTDILAWQPNHYYFLGEMCLFGGRKFQRITDGTSLAISNATELATWIDVDAIKYAPYRTEYVTAGGVQVVRNTIEVTSTT
jgi:hypothetical protein